MKKNEKKILKTVRKQLQFLVEEFLEKSPPLDIDESSQENINELKNMITKTFWLLKGHQYEKFKR